MIATPAHSFSAGRITRVAYVFALATARFVVSLFFTLLGLALVTFLITRVVPIDPVLVMVGDRASPATYEAARQALGLDKPLYQQFLAYLAQLATGDLGQSVMTGRSVLSDTMRVFPATFELAVVSTVIGSLIGIPLGVLAAVRRGRATDHLVRVVSLIGYSLPVFWLGLVGLLVFYARLGWVAGPGRIDIAYQYSVPATTGFVVLDAILAGEWSAASNALSHLVLPASILAYVSMAFIARMTRSLMIEQLGQEYVLTARVKGMPARIVIWRHAFGNVIVPVITVVALTFAYLLEGAVLTETVFAWPGLGLYITQALFSADLNAVLGGTLVIGVSFVILNRCADFLYQFFDPRTR